MQDTATQAMTEVALGLSMAFFALLILALISIGVPAQSNSQALSNDILTAEKIAINDNKVDAKKSSSQTKASADSAANKHIVLFWQHQYYDLNMHILDVSSLVNEVSENSAKSQQAADIIVAVPANTSLKSLLSVQASFKPHNIQVTQLTPSWEHAFSTKASSGQ